MDASESGRAASEDERSENSELAKAGDGASRRRRREEADTAGGAAHKKPRSVCPHQRRKSTCKECGGASICQHQRIRSKCKECGGAGICQHQRRRSDCKECGGASICPHQRQRSRCKECGGASICPHQRQRSKCKECHEEADESMPAGLEELERSSSKVARSAGERGSGAVGAAFGAAGESAPLVMETEPVSGCTGPAPVGRRVKRKPNIIDRGASAASASGP